MWPEPRGVKRRFKNCSAKGERHRSSYYCLACSKVDRRKFVKYNEHMNGVDHSDQMRTQYSTARNSKRWSGHTYSGF